MMHRRRILLLVPLSLVIIPLAGCVPVIEPLSDLTKAKPDKRLLGRWHTSQNPADFDEIDIPAMKSNPEGLMRFVQNGNADDPGRFCWFFTTAIGKHTYATICLGPSDPVRSADFRKEGAFEKWHKGKKRYYIVRFVLDGDKLTTDSGDHKVMKKLMQAEKIEHERGFFETPPGWLASYLEKNGPEALFNGKNVLSLHRTCRSMP
jgi:hypothetical protein